MFVSLWQYYREIDAFIKEHPGQVLTLRFEDMKTVCYTFFPRRYVRYDTSTGVLTETESIE